MVKKEDRRTRITKLLLNNSFLELLALKPISRIKVKDICENADLNRSTYYRYYTDPYDQLNKLEASIIEEIVEGEFAGKILQRNEVFDPPGIPR